MYSVGIRIRPTSAGAQQSSASPQGCTSQVCMSHAYNTKLKVYRTVTSIFASRIKFVVRPGKINLQFIVTARIRVEF